MGDTAKVFVAGVIAVALVTAFGTHARGLSQVGRAGGAAGSRLLGTAEGK